MTLRMTFSTVSLPSHFLYNFLWAVRNGLIQRQLLHPVVQQTGHYTSGPRWFLVMLDIMHALMIFALIELEAKHDWNDDPSEVQTWNWPGLCCHSFSSTHDAVALCNLSFVSTCFVVCRVVFSQCTWLFKRILQQVSDWGVCYELPLKHIKSLNHKKPLF